VQGTIATYYHWADPSMGDQVLTRKTLTNDRTLYVCDDYWTWASPHIPEMTLYEVDALFKKPLVINGQFEEYERIFSDHNAVNARFLRNGGFDAVIYTPHPLSRGVRQIALLRPKDQVLAIRRVPNHEIDWESIKHMRDEQCSGWTAIMRNKELDERITMIDSYDQAWKNWQAESAKRAMVNLNPGEIIAMGEVFDHTVDLETIAAAVLQEQHLRAQGPNRNLYFHDKKVYLDNTSIYPEEGLKKAIKKLGGEVTTDVKSADLIVYGPDTDLRFDLSPTPEEIYPKAMFCWEGKIDDLVQELPEGIESLF
jgi:hypothetical protein